MRHRITTFELRAGTARRLIPLRRPDWIIERAQVLDWLAKQAQRAGAEVRHHWRFVDARDGMLVFHGPDGEYHEERARTVIAADGAHSRVSRAFSMPSPSRIPLLQARVNLPSWAHPEHSIVWFDPTTTPYFYWLIPDSPQSGVVGLAADPGQPIRRLLDRFLAELDLEPLEYQAGQAAAYRPGLSFRTVRQGRQILRVGDAGGQVKITTVGGTVTGLWGAMAAVNAVLGTGLAVARRLEAELLAHWFLRRLLHCFSLEDYERLIHGLNRQSLNWLAATPRDYLAQGAARLLLAQPRMAWWALRALLR